MTSERFEEIKARAKLFNEAVKFYGVHELIEQVELQERALRHVSSKSPVCEGCTSPEISLVEHYTFVADQALMRLK